MKKSTCIFAITSAFLILNATGCSFLQKTIVNETPEASLEVPQDRRPVVPVRQSATYTPDELKNGIVKGDWTIEQVDGKPVIAESAPYITFEPLQGRIYGNNGCNTINGNFRYSVEQKSITISDLITTMRACELEGISDTEINIALNSAVSYRLEEKNHEYWMYLVNAKGETVLALMHQNFDFLNGTWLVQSIKDKKINIKGAMLVPSMKLVIDVPEGKVHGYTGCNILNGDLVVDMDRANSISFQNMATTRKACRADKNYETDMLVTLEEVTTAHPVDATTVELLNSQKQVIMVLVRTSDTM